MKRILFVLLSFSCVFMGLIAQEDTTKVLNLDEIVVSSLYTQSNTLSNTIKSEELVDKNYGQEPSHFFTKMPSIVSTNDNGTEYGYGYYRIRGLDQTRINVTLDGCPWNEAEDYGAYFANSPDLLSSLSSIKIERGTASEGKSTLTRDIANYFGLPYSTEYGRDYMEYYGKNDTDLTVTDFQEFLIEQRRYTKQIIEQNNNSGIVIADTDNLVTLMYAKAYVEDDDIDLTSEDYKTLKQLARNIKRGIQWDKIYLLPPKNTFVDDGTRYMKQSTLTERNKNYQILVQLLKEFGWWNKVEILDGDYLENFETVKTYIQNKFNYD